MSEEINLEGQRILLASPEHLPANRSFVGRERELRLCRAAWRVSPDGRSLEEDDRLRLHFRLQGPPGVGKNELVYQLARALGRDLYMIQGHDEITPEDLALLLVPDAQAARSGPAALVLRASPLATALYRGALFFFDEINRVPERSLSPLASVLDERMYIYSAMTGLRVGPRTEVERHRFRFCCALNPTVSTSGAGALPDYLEQRTLPVIKVGHPSFADLRQIVLLALAPTEELLEAFERWQRSEGRTDLSIRQALSLVRYAGALLEGVSGSARAAIEQAAAQMLSQPASRATQEREDCL